MIKGSLERKRKFAEIWTLFYYITLQMALQNITQNLHKTLSKSCQNDTNGVSLERFHQDLSKTYRNFRVFSIKLMSNLSKWYKLTGKVWKPIEPDEIGRADGIYSSKLMTFFVHMSSKLYLNNRFPQLSGFFFVLFHFVVVENKFRLRIKKFPKYWIQRMRK